MPDEYVMPGYNLDAFHCPHCGVYAHQTWSYLLTESDCVSIMKDIAGRSFPTATMKATCSRCRKITLWQDTEQVWPLSAVGPRPNEDLEEDIITLYEEARNVGSLSPRSAAALLRLCTEMLVTRLCKEKNINHKDLNDGIARLVDEGLPVTIQQALDTLRVTGNEAVHPGQIYFEDDYETVQSLFEFLNLIAHDRITQPTKVADRFSKLPPAARQGIEDRDAC